MQINGVNIQNEFAEAFRMWAARLIVTAVNERWAAIAAHETTGYATSVIQCDAEAGIERTLTADQTPDGRPGVSLLIFAFNAESLGKAIVKRTGQCLMTCPTTAVYDGMPDLEKSETSDRLPLGQQVRFFGDGFQRSKVVAGRRYWRIPVMEGEFLVEDTVGACKAIAGGNFLMLGRDMATTLAAAERAVDAIAPLPDVVTPFPGGIVRSGSKVGSIYEKLIASTNDEYCPTLRPRVETKLPGGAGCTYEIVINGLSEAAIRDAIVAGVHAACVTGPPAVVDISAGNYGGKLGKFHFHLTDVLGGGEA